MSERLEALLHGDCLEVMKDIPDNSVDMVLTDPPYGTTACKWDTVIPFEPMWLELKRIVKDNGAICLFGSEPFSSALRMSNIKMYKYDWYWDKRNAGNSVQAKRMPLKNIELISVFNVAKTLPKYSPIFTYRDKPQRVKRKTLTKNESIPVNRKDIDTSYTKKYPYTYLDFGMDYVNRGIHPNLKPVDLLEYLIKTYTQENEVVLDFTMGSGSTGVAAKNLNRDFIGIEQDDYYFSIAEARIAGNEELLSKLKAEKKK